MASVSRNWAPFSGFREPNKVAESPRLCKGGSEAEEPWGGMDRSREALAGRSCVLFLGRPGF